MEKVKTGASPAAISVRSWDGFAPLWKLRIPGCEDADPETRVADLSVIKVSGMCRIVGNYGKINSRTCNSSVTDFPSGAVSLLQVVATWKRTARSADR